MVKFCLLMVLWLLVTGAACDTKTSDDTNLTKSRSAYCWHVMVDPSGSGNSVGVWTDTEPQVTGQRVVVTNARIAQSATGSNIAQERYDFYSVYKSITIVGGFIDVSKQC